MDLTMQVPQIEPQEFEEMLNSNMKVSTSRKNYSKTNVNSLTLITFSNSLDPDQARQNVRPDLDPNCLTLLWYS